MQKCIHPFYDGILEKHSTFFTLKLNYKNNNSQEVDYNDVQFKDGVTKQTIKLTHTIHSDTDSKGLLCNILHVNNPDNNVRVLFVYHKSNLIFNITFSPVLTFADFYVPKELSVTPTQLEKVVIIGPCTTLETERYFKTINKNLQTVIINTMNASILPDKPLDFFSDIDMTIIRLPQDPLLLNCIWYEEMLKDEFYNILKKRVFNAIQIYLKTALKYNSLYNNLTVICNLIAPQTPPLISYWKGHQIRDIVTECNLFIRDFVKNFKNVYVVDMDNMCSSYGKMGLIDDSSHLTYRGGLYSNHREYIREQYANGALNQIRIDDFLEKENLYGFDKNKITFYRGLYDVLVGIKKTYNQIDTVKMVIFDLDNTLWRGVLAEDYVNGNDNLGQKRWFCGIHEAIACLKVRGIAVCIVSKNDFKLVEEKINKITPYKLNDFVCAKINYELKSVNIAQILKETNILEHNVLFVDDNPHERQEVQNVFPKIRTIGSEIHTLKRVLLWSPETQILEHTQESINKTNLLKATVENNINLSSINRIDFINSLNITITIKKLESVNDTAYRRCFELLNKTNQFNLNGERLTQTYFNECLKNQNILFVSVKDDNINHGIVSVLIYEQKENLINVLHYVMSCRTIGLDIEYFVLKQLTPHLITFNYTPTELNQPIQTFLEKTCRLQDQTHNYIFNNVEYTLPNITVFYEN
jgi:FkbH-like protein